MAVAGVPPGRGGATRQSQPRVINDAFGMLPDTLDGLKRRERAGSVLINGSSYSAQETTCEAPQPGSRTGYNNPPPMKQVSPDQFMHIVLPSTAHVFSRERPSRQHFC